MGMSEDRLRHLVPLQLFYKASKLLEIVESNQHSKLEEHSSPLFAERRRAHRALILHRRKPSLGGCSFSIWSRPPFPYTGSILQNGDHTEDEDQHCDNDEGAGVSQGQSRDSHESHPSARPERLRSTSILEEDLTYLTGPAE